MAARMSIKDEEYEKQKQARRDKRKEDNQVEWDRRTKDQEKRMEDSKLYLENRIETGEKGSYEYAEVPRLLRLRCPRCPCLLPRCPVARAGLRSPQLAPSIGGAVCVLPSPVADMPS